MSKREKTLLALLVAIGGGGMFLLLFFMPIRERIAGLHSSIAAAETQLAAAKLRTERFAELERRHAEIASRIHELAGDAEAAVIELPDQHNIMWVLEMLERTVYEFTDEMTVFLHAPVPVDERDERLMSHRVELSFTASYEDALAILERFMRYDEQERRHRLVDYRISDISRAPFFDEHGEEIAGAADDFEGDWERASIGHADVVFSLNLQLEFLVRHAAGEDAAAGHALVPDAEDGGE